MLLLYRLSIILKSFLGSNSFVTEKQEKAGSLANLCTSSYMCSELAVEVKDKEKTEEVDDILESGEVISVCEFQQCYLEFRMVDCIFCMASLLK